MPTLAPLPTLGYSSSSHQAALTAKMNGHIDVEDISGITEVTTTELHDVHHPMGSALAPQDDNMDDSVTRCICDFQHDDGYMICCDRCR